MLDKLKSGLALISGWLLAASVALFWLLSRRRRPATTPKVVPKTVPDAWEEVEKAARKEGIIK